MYCYTKRKIRSELILVDWRALISLENEEYIVEDCNLSGFGSSTHDWAFVLTNQRLIALVKKFAQDNQEIKSLEQKGVFPLESIRDIGKGDFEIIIYANERKQVLKSCKIMSCSGEPPALPGTYTPDSAFVYFRNRIVQQINERRQELERKKAPVLIDFSFLKTFIEKGGIMLTILKCPHCSAPIKMPKNGTETKCDHCGSAIYAQDIFEKVKALIG